ncbi:MAG: glycosyltransferase family 1 protein [Acidobacteria bacterium]|nr:glycosyltransferase family 1 protein [Acidobacteriota bacterium]
MNETAVGPRSIGVVAYEMEGEPTGVGRYTEELLAALRRTPRAEDWSLRLYFKGDPFDHPLWTGKAGGTSRCEAVFDRRPGAHPILWEQFRLPRLLRREQPDVVFSPGYSLPRTPERPSLVTIHDLSFEHLPGDFGFRELRRRRYLARSAARAATRVLTDTRRTAADLRQRYGLPADRVAVVPLGVSPHFAAARESSGTGERKQDRMLAELGVRRPYLLVLGSILPRRRLDLVLRALGRLLREPGPGGSGWDAGPVNLDQLRLVIAGRNQLPRRGELDRLIRAGDWKERVVRLGYVDDDLLPPLYARALGTVYVSDYEGYGLPPLESLAAGTPVLVSDAPALAELWPEYPLRCAKLEIDVLTEGLRRLVLDEEARRLARGEGPERVRSLTWDRAAERFADQVEAVWRMAREKGP